MSLIAEALKAAQDARSEPGDRARQTATARRILAPAVRTGSARRALEVPKQLQVALAVFGVALATAAAVVVAAPSAGDQRLPGAAELAASPMLPREGSAGDLADDRSDAGPEAATAELEGVSGEESGPAIVADDRSVDASFGSAREPAGTAAARPTGPSGGGAREPGATPEMGSPDPDLTVPAAAAVPAADARAERRGSPGGGFELRMGAPRGSGQWFADALSAQRRRDYGAAIQLYERALQETPDNVEALNNLGTVYQASGNLAAAREAFRRAITVQPGYAAAWSNLGVVLGALGELSQSQAALIEAIRLDPANHGARVNLALQYQKQGLAGEARRLLDEVVRDAPAMAEAHYALGRLLEQESDRDGAVRHYRLFLSTASGRFPPLEAAVRQRIQQLGG